MKIMKNTQKIQNAGKTEMSYLDCVHTVYTIPIYTQGEMWMWIYCV